MALTPEDKKDVKTHLGKALAKKVSKVTTDSKMSKKYGATFGDIHKAYSNKNLGGKSKPRKEGLIAKLERHKNMDPDVGIDF